MILTPKFKAIFSSFEVVENKTANLVPHHIHKFYIGMV